MTITKANIDIFLTHKNIAVIGASARTKKFGNEVIKELVKKGYAVYPIHLTAETLEGVKCYHSIGELPAEVQSIHISTNNKKANDIIVAAKQKGMTQIWVQQRSENEKTYDLANGVNMITNQCFLMHLGPVKGGHKFHRSIKSFFGKLPK
ncbi:MAG: hypothetical protein CVU05_10540 [Bacteroidetes bacterium HGW-Bacteroidetes-21]|jgi:hypothetical protein|nr:MAG: hypothetical protein CVU05_10540 [Bacteroidetes bacterium HGW-Bacteroidetes-21]